MPDRSSGTRTGPENLIDTRAEGLAPCREIPAIVGRGVIVVEAGGLEECLHFGGRQRRELATQPDSRFLGDYRVGERSAPERHSSQADPARGAVAPDRERRPAREVDLVGPERRA